jgi:hypothetical protein
LTNHDSSHQQRVHRIGQTKPISGKSRPNLSPAYSHRFRTVKTLAIRNSAEELMISRRAQLKGQDQKSSLTDDFTMRNFISVRTPPSRSDNGSILFFFSPSLSSEPEFHAREGV